MNDPDQCQTWNDPVEIVHHLNDDCHLLEVNDTIIVHIIKFERPVEFGLRYDKEKFTLNIFF